MEKSDIDNRARVSGEKKNKGESTLIQIPTCIHAAVHYGICPAPVAVGTSVSLSPLRLIFPPSGLFSIMRKYRDFTEQLDVLDR